MGLFSFLTRAGSGPDEPALLVNDQGEVLVGADGKPVQVAPPTTALAGLLEASASTPAFDFDAHPEAQALKAKLASLESFAAQAKADKIQALKATAAARAETVVQSSKVLPAGQAHLEALLAHQSLAAAGLPTDGLDPAAALAGLLEALPGHSLAAPLAGHGDLSAVANGSTGPADRKPLTPERRRHLLSQTATGREVLRREDEARLGAGAAATNGVA